MAWNAHMGLVWCIYPAVHWTISQIMVLLALNVAFAGNRLHTPYTCSFFSLV